MRIIDRILPGKQFLSLEFFPPKNTSDWPAFFRVVDKLRALQPLFVSVTYGAGGSTSDNTLAMVTRMKQEFSLEPMAHLTCVGANEKNILDFIDHLAAAGVDNILALRGDPPQDPGVVLPESKDFIFASDLVSFVRKHYPSLGIGVAGYPEGHPEAVSLEKDVQFLKNKVDLGGDFVVTQLFFDNDYYWDFVQRARESGNEKPIIPGVMPIFSLKVIQKVVQLCGATIPAQLLRELEEADEQGGADAVLALGIRHARSQILGLLKGGVPGVHLYTLNRDDACLELLDGIF
ncbi:MAG: methylenetetrahydrofolate reductase [NAD(P)H] [Geobacter sp.]|nr:MAG: methylenetetrahydrofolate reductase [NAD(P)H] [Geobacter sp.]